MNLDLEIWDIGKVQVLLAKVESIPDHRFQHYKSILQELSSVNLELVNFENETQELLVQVCASYMKGKVTYKFNTSKFPNENFPLQLHKNFLMVIGIGEQVENIMQAYSELNQLVAHFNSVLVWRLFVFEPKEEDSVYEPKAPNLILFHPCLNETRLYASIEIVIQDLTGMLLAGLLRLLASSQESELIAVPSETDLSRVKKRKPGRYCKLVGDLCLIFSCESEAKSHYKDALELQKGQNDWLWMAATSEAILNVEAAYQPYERLKHRFKDIKTYYGKVRQWKKAIEVQFMQARYLIGAGLKASALGLLTETYEEMRNEAVPSDILSVCVKIGEICEQIGFHRKAGFFRKLGAQECRQLGSFEEAHSLLARAAHSYQIFGIEDYQRPQKRQDFNRHLYTVRENMKPWNRGQFQGWKRIQREILENLKAISRELGDVSSSALYTWDMLLILHPTLLPSVQQQLRLEIEQDAVHVNKPLTFRPLVQVRSIDPQKYSLEITRASEEQVFMYNPWQNKDNELNWVKGGIHTVSVVLRNTLGFPLPVEPTRLVVQGSVESCPTSSNLCPNSDTTLNYILIPLASGPLAITALQLNSLGLTSCIPIDPITIEVMESLPELKFTLTPSKINMYYSEQTHIQLLVSNISSEPLGKFQISSDNSEVVSFPPEQIGSLQNLPVGAKQTLDIHISATGDSQTVNFELNYSNLEETIWLKDTLSLELNVTMGVEVTQAFAEPMFSHKWQSIIKEINPAMSSICNSFKERTEDKGCNDNEHCWLKFQVQNHTSDEIKLKGKLTNPQKTEKVSITIFPESYGTLSLSLERVPNFEVKSLVANLKLTWKTHKHKRKGTLSHFKFSESDYVHMEQPKAKFLFEKVPNGSFTKGVVKVECSGLKKSEYLYLYSFKKERETIKLSPEDLVIAGSLSVPLVSSDSFQHEINYIALEQNEYFLTAGLGSKYRINWWSHESWSL